MFQIILAKHFASTFLSPFNNCGLQQSVCFFLWTISSTSASFLSQKNNHIRAVKRWGTRKNAWLKIK